MLCSYLRRLRIAAALLAGTVGLAACSGWHKVPHPAGATFANTVRSATTAPRLAALLPADVILLGEQHDVPAHQHAMAQVIAALARQGALAAVAIEMAEAGATTATLAPNASEEQVRAALRWNEAGWPWAAYGPAVMTAVRASAPVLGANLPLVEMRARMADSQLDTRLPGPALQTQRDLIRSGHCGLLPESQIAPMTRVQIARDLEMAQTIQAALLPGKTVVLLAGSGHVNRRLGVPHHLPESLTVRAVRLQAAGGTEPDAAAFDSVWSEGDAPQVDYCAQLRRQKPA
jgi:uncharacterized iron-regulated protein